MSDVVAREDRQDIADVMVRYAAGIDTRDWPLLRTCFTDDCRVDFGVMGEWHGGDEFIEGMRVLHDPLGHTLHRITNVTIRPDGAGATAHSYVDALVLFPDNLTGTRAAGYYDDQLVRRDGEWKIVAHRFTPVLLQMVPGGNVVDLDGSG